MTDLRAAVCVPTFGDFDARTLGELAAAAEDAGWDGFFCWDHVLWDPLGRGVADTGEVGVEEQHRLDF